LRSAVAGLGLFDERGREGPEWPDWLGALMRRMGGTRGTKAGARGSCQVSSVTASFASEGASSGSSSLVEATFDMGSGRRPVQGRRGFGVALEGREKVRAVLGRLGRLSGSMELSSK